MKRSFKKKPCSILVNIHSGQCWFISRQEWRIHQIFISRNLTHTLNEEHLTDRFWCCLRGPHALPVPPLLKSSFLLTHTLGGNGLGSGITATLRKTRLSSRCLIMAWSSLHCCIHFGETQVSISLSNQHLFWNNTLLILERKLIKSSETVKIYTVNNWA